MDRFEKRWRQRQDGAPGGPGPATVTVTVSKQVAVRVTSDRLWDLVWDPATSPLVLDEVVAAFTLPGTPARQVGEMQVHIVAGEGGTLIGMIEEVVEVGPGYRAVTRVQIHRTTGNLDHVDPAPGPGRVRAASPPRTTCPG